MGLYSVMVIYDESSLLSSNLFSVNYQAEYMLALQDAVARRKHSDSMITPLILHWIQVPINSSDETIADLLLRNVELGVQVKYI